MRFNMLYVDTCIHIKKDVAKISWQAWNEIFKNIQNEMISNEIFN
jgi:hypothetical protein